MCTRFLYIDGENLSKETIVDFVDGFVSSLDKTDTLVGKFYGAKDLVKASVPFCMLNGLRYVETSSINFSSKNVADMKITVDCIYDVTEYLQNNTDFTVTLLSKDSDFLPLVFKLKELGVDVDIPLFDLTTYSGHLKTTGDLDAFLKHLGFYSKKNIDCLDNMFVSIRSLADESFSDVIIEGHIRFRIRKFISYLENTYGASYARMLDKLPIKCFSLENVIRCLGFTDKETLNQIYLAYVSKIYGYIPKRKTIPDNLFKKIITLPNFDCVV